MLIFDARNKQVALKRIKRLAVSGLPLEPFVLTLFELMNDAIPSSPLKDFIVPANTRAEQMIFNSPELRPAALIADEVFFNERVDLEGAGLRFPQTLRAFFKTPLNKVVLRHEEMFLPSFQQKEPFNRATRPLGWWQCSIVLFREGAELYGGYPIWREKGQRDLSKADYDFAEACAPHITHGLRVAQLVEERAPADANTFIPSALWGTGVVLMDRAGKVIAIDEPARRAFGQLAFLRSGRNGEIDRKIHEGLGHVHKTVISTMLKPEENGRTPCIHFFAHWSGATLKLRGTLAHGIDGTDYVTVLVERGETVEIRRQRMMYRWGLTPRESEVLGYVAMGKTNAEIGTILEMSQLTVKKHLEHILKTLNVETRTAAAAAAAESARTAY